MLPAIIVLLSSTATVDGEAYELGHLNMFDENTLKELEANPDGTKYPMAVFKFSEDGNEKNRLEHSFNSFFIISE